MNTDRILQYLDFKGINKRQFYLKTGLSNGFLDKVKDIGGSKIEIILYAYPEINPTWLITGKGPMILKVTADLDTNSEVKLKVIPLANMAAIGGNSISSFGIGTEDVKDYYVVPKFEEKKVDFMIEVLGASMAPQYNTGDIVACRIIAESNFIQWNQAHVIATKGQGIIIKRIKKGTDSNSLLMCSDNPIYEPFDVPKDEITGIALVVGVIKLE